ncbi:hypothetical protein CRENBAI_020043 [Crenichthys baileyi]|uniref:Uncharacterized protein n=1 Tax=Crenichthys baileyi TaxID=28760 RepID=A0AAV9RX63_9TELE
MEPEDRDGGSLLQDSDRRSTPGMHPTSTIIRSSLPSGETGSKTPVGTTRCAPSFHSYQSLPDWMGRHTWETPRTPLGACQEKHHEHCLTIIEGHVKLSFHFKTGSEISLMCSILFEKVSRAMLSLSKPFQGKTCDVSVISHTQDRSCITSWVGLDITLQDMTLVHPIYRCTLDTEPFPGGQDLQDSYHT